MEDDLITTSTSAFEDIFSERSVDFRYSAIFYILMARNKSPATPEEGDDSVNAIFSPTPQTYEYPDLLVVFPIEVAVLMQ